MCICLVRSPTQPVSHWKLDEGMGITAYDSVGTNHGTIYGAVWTTGQVGGALSFNGLNDYVDLGNDSSLEFGLPVTISAWIKMDRLNDNMMIATDASSLYYSGVWLQAHLGFLEIGYGDATGAGDVTRRSKITSPVLQTNTWYHVAGVIRGATDMDLYINGVDNGGVYSGSGSNVAYSSASAKIGTNAPWDSFFQGKIDEVAIYNEALSAIEIQQQYLVGIPEPGMLSFMALTGLAMCLQKKK